MYSIRCWFFVVLGLGSGLVSAQQSPTIGGCPSFPANNIWNVRVDNLPVDTHSADYINSISGSAGLRYDITIPVNIVSGSQAKVPLRINYPDESDPGPYPIPANAQIEQGSDLHVLVVDRDNCMLYETFYSSLNADGSWTVDSSAKWSLLSNALRPAGWTSADAAGLPMMPGLLRYDEVAAGQVNHALRFTAPRTQRLFVWPGRHYASSNTSALLPPMGQRFRLKANFDISPYSPRVQTLLRAMKQYGLMLADNGLAWEMQFDLDPRWNFDEFAVLRGITGSNLEAVDVSSLMVNPDSGQVRTSGTTSQRTIAVFRNVAWAGLWFLDVNGNGAFDAPDRSTPFGLANDQPVAGDWDGTGVVRIGVFRDGFWYLDLNNNGQWDGVGGGDGIFAFGLPGDRPVVGDWNGDGRSKFGIFRCPQTSVCTWIVDYAGRFAYDPATARTSFYGLKGDLPVVNRWNAASLVDQVGVYRSMPDGSGLWIVDSNGSGVWEPSDQTFAFGLAGDIPVVGSWTGGTGKQIGIFRVGMWILDSNGNKAYDATDAMEFFGLPGDLPVVR